MRKLYGISPIYIRRAIQENEIEEMRREHESELLHIKLEYTEKIVAVCDCLIKKEACDDIL